MLANPICLVLERQDVVRAFSRAWAKTGKRIAARIAIIAITTNSSIKVNPVRLFMTASFVLCLRRLYENVWSVAMSLVSSARRGVRLEAGGRPAGPFGRGETSRRSRTLPRREA